MKALISDIHGNFQALSAVCEDIDSHDVDSIICLGDIVGYGAEPEACIDFVITKAQHSLMGNHDFALFNGPVGFNPLAADIIYLTKIRMEPSEGGSDTPETSGVEFFPCIQQGLNPPCLILKHSKPERWEYIKNLDYTLKEDSVLYLHGSPIDPVYEYVFPDKFTSVWAPERIKEMFPFTDWLIFCGHTHHPCTIASDMTCAYPPDVDYTMKLDKNLKYIINIGSVGQPRDRDPRACYLLFDEKGGSIEWRRVEYDIDAAIEKNTEMCGERNWCGERLLYGK
jgi:diadenosine tetraphosphatase ApaH/serine/threonine PP2A family protein phosphatase